MPGKHDIRLSRQVLSVNPESKSKVVKDGSDNEFGLGVLSANAGHVPASSLRCEPVH